MMLGELEDMLAVGQSLYADLPGRLANTNPPSTIPQIFLPPLTDQISSWFQIQKYLSWSYQSAVTPLQDFLKHKGERRLNMHL